MSKDIIRTPHYSVRCPRCGCCFTFELEDFIAKNPNYNDKDYVSCPYCEDKIQVRNRDTHALLPNVKIDYTGGKLNKKMVTIADWSFPEERFESVGFWAQERDDEYKVEYVFEIKLKDKSTTTIDTVDEETARLWATQLNIDLQAWEKEIQEAIQ